MRETIRRGRLAEYAYEYTKRMLFDGTLSPGAKLRVEDVVSSLHTSRQPVMDAFKRLAAEGYLEITPQVGCRVVVPDAAEIADFFLILGAVLGIGADIAAERRSDAELERLNRIAADFDALNGVAVEPQAFRRLDQDFQQLISRMAHSEPIAHLAAGLLDRREFYILNIVDGESRFAGQVREASGRHRAIVDAISTRDAEAARSLTEALVLNLGRFALGTPTPTMASV